MILAIYETAMCKSTMTMTMETEEEEGEKKEGKEVIDIDREKQISSFC